MKIKNKNKHFYSAKAHDCGLFLYGLSIIFFFILVFKNIYKKNVCGNFRPENNSKPVLKEKEETKFLTFGKF